MAADTGAVMELAGQLAAERIEKVALEATSRLLAIWFYVLEAAGLGVQLVNSRDVTNVPGRPKRDARLRVAGEADRAGDAAAQFRAARRDPAAAATIPGCGPI